MPSHSLMFLCSGWCCCRHVTCLVPAGDGNIATDWRLAAERIAAVVLEANARLLMFVEGTESAGGEHGWWGGVLTAAGRAPVRLPVEGKLVYSPHVYGPSVHAQVRRTMLGLVDCAAPA